MTIIKANTAKGRTMLNNARANEGTELWQIYDTYSPAKRRSFEACKALCYNEGGCNFRIISHNTFGYSVAWETAEGTRIETAQNSYLIKA
jgi:hypothetical protein